jgi:hypothetical protein
MKPGSILMNLIAVLPGNAGNPLSGLSLALALRPGMRTRGDYYIMKIEIAPLKTSQETVPRNSGEVFENGPTKNGIGVMCSLVTQYTRRGKGQGI